VGRTLKALILAGGYATRLRPLFPLLGKPLLKKNLEMLAKIGVTEVVLALNYLSEVLMEEMGSRYAGITLQYSHEQKPLGTGGPIKNASNFLEGEDMFLAMNGDVLFDEDIIGRGGYEVLLKNQSLEKWKVP
jgi:NDP-sugar pyrophosphorylase family protein